MQVKQWFKLLRHTNIDRTDLSRAFFDIRQKLLAAEDAHRWQMVKGPMGATIATIHAIGWNPITLFKWVGEDPMLGGPWTWSSKVNQDPDPSQLLELVDWDLQLPLWRRASLGRHGQGMEDGVDLTVLVREVNKALSNRTLQCIAAGGIWTQKRLHEAGLAESPLCYQCHQEEDDHHYFWGCPSIAALGEEAIERTSTAWWRRISDSEDPHYCQCFFLRGLVPSLRTRRDPPWQAEEHENYDRDINLTMHSYAYGDVIPTDYPVYLDGSGGPHTRDTRLRRCAWAWVQITGPAEEYALRHGLSGACTSLYQTVPRAEIQALRELLVALVCSDVSGCHYEVFSDNEGVVKGWHAGAEKCRSLDASAMWQRVWTSMDTLQARGVTITVNKIKAHLTMDDVREGRMSRQDCEGNKKADELAGLAASSLCDQEHVDRVAFADAQAYLCLQRLYTIVTRRGAERERTTTQPVIRVLQPTIADMFQIGTGCQLVRQGRRYQCRKCLQVFHVDGIHSGSARATLKSIAEERALQCPVEPSWAPQVACIKTVILPKISTGN